MATPEGKVKDRVKKVLAARGAYWHMPVQNGMGAPTLDFIGCQCGMFFAIETKAGNGKPTPRQEITIKKMQDAGAMVFVVNDITGTELLDMWLMTTLLSKGNNKC